MYCSSKQSYYYEHRIINVTSKSLKHSSKSLLTQYIAVRHQYTFYRVQVVAELAIIKKCNVYNVIKHSHLFRVCQSTVVSFTLSQIIYNYLQKKSLVHRVWATEKIIYLPLCYNACIKNRENLSLCLIFEQFSFENVEYTPNVVS